MTQAVYSSAQVARILGVLSGMVRRYAMALEELTGEQIPQHPRDGRQFTQEHVDALVSTRRFVAGRQGMSVETGLQLALGLAELPAATLLPTATDASGTVGVEALKTALGEVIGPLLTQLQTADSGAQVEVLREAITAPIVAELRQLRAAVEALQPDPDEIPEPPEEAEELIRALRSELKTARRGAADMQKLRSEVTAPKALPPAVDAKRIDRVLEAEMHEGRPPPEQPATADGPMVREARWLERRLRR